MTRPLRVCMVTTFYPPFNFGGDGIFVQRLATELADRGHEVEVVHCADAYRVLASAERQTTSTTDHPRVTVHRLESPFGILSPMTTQQTGLPLFKTARLRRILSAGFDVIHFHNVSLIGGPGVLELGDAIKLYTLHEYWLMCPTHVLFKYNREACTKRNCLPCQLAYKRPPQWWRYSGLTRSGTEHIDAFLAPSRHVMQKHREWWPEMPMVHLPHFVPSVPLARADPSAPPYVLFVGRLEKLKGLQTVIPLFRDYPHAQLWIAGTGTYESQLRALAGNSPNIRFLGFQGGEALQALFRHAVAMIMPSINYEVAPLVVMESFRQQTPALVGNIGSMPEPIEDSGGGFVYDNLEELRRHLDRLCGDRALRDDLGMRGYHASLERWSADVHVGRYLEVIQELGQKRRRAAV